MTLVHNMPSTAPAEVEDGGLNEARRKGWVFNKQSGSFHKSWVRCFMVVKEGSVNLYAVRFLPFVGNLCCLEYYINCHDALYIYIFILM